MKKMISTTFAALVATTAAIATPAEPSSQASAFKGWYAGIEGGYTTYHIENYGNCGKGPHLNGFVGYNHRQDGNWVLGGEVQFGKTFDNNKKNRNLTFSPTFDIAGSAKAGYIFADDLMVFTKLGYNFGSYRIITKDGEFSIPASIVLMGVGLEKSFGQFSVRATYDINFADLKFNNVQTYPYTGHKFLTGISYNF